MPATPDPTSEPSAALEVRQPESASAAMAAIGLPSPAEWAALTGLAEQLAESSLVPTALRRKPADVMLVILTGRDLGITPTTALKLVHVVDGKTGLAAELMVALARRAGYQIWPDPENDRTKAIAHTERDGRAYSLTFTLVDAQSAGLCTITEDGKPRARSTSGKVLPWEAYTQFMLWSRAVSGLCRQVYPDLLMGVSYTPDELGAEVDHEGRPIEASAYRSAGSPDPAHEAAQRDARAREAGWDDHAASEAAWADLVGRIHEAGPLVEAATKLWKRAHPGRSVDVWADTIVALDWMTARTADHDEDPMGDDSPGFLAAEAAALVAQLDAEVERETPTIPDNPEFDVDAVDNEPRSLDADTSTAVPDLMENLNRSLADAKAARDARMAAGTASAAGDAELDPS